MRRAAQGLARLIGRGQKLDVGPRVALSETAPPIDCRPDLADGHVTRDQPRRLRPAQSRYLLDVTPHLAPPRLAPLGVRLLDEHLLYPAIDLLPIFTLEPDFLAGLNEPANRFQTQLLCFAHADVQSPACLILQAHLVLEESRD